MHSRRSRHDPKISIGSHTIDEPNKEAASGQTYRVESIFNRSQDFPFYTHHHPHFPSVFRFSLAPTLQPLHSVGCEIHNSNFETSVASLMHV